MDLSDPNVILNKISCRLQGLLILTSHDQYPR